MILCLCERITDGRLRNELAAGAQTVRELCKRTGAGSNCGACVCDIKELVAEAAPLRPRPEDGRLAAK